MAKEFDLTAEYGKLATKYNLPDFEELDNQFEITSLQDVNKKFLLKAIRRRMIDKIVFFNRILESILHPNTQSIISMHENKSFDEDERQKVIKSLRKLMKLDRESLRLDIEPNTISDANFIIKIFEEYKDIKRKINRVASIMEEAWSKEEEEIVSESYFG